MPYQWTTKPDEPLQELKLWPHNSLPQKGLAAFVLSTFTLICIPAIPLLGTPVLWGLLPFLLAAVWGVFFALRYNQRTRQITEILTLDGDEARLCRTEPSGTTHDWACDRYWTTITKYDDDGPVPHYLTLRGKGREVEIGAFLSEKERLSLYDELKLAWNRQS